MKGLEYRGLTKVDGPIIILERTEDVGLGEFVVRLRPGPGRARGQDHRALRAGGGGPDLRVQHGAFHGDHLRGVPRLPPGAPRLPGHAGTDLRRARQAHRRLPGSLQLSDPGRERRPHQSGRPDLSAGLHPDGSLMHRRDEHADPRPEAPDLLRQRSAPQPAGRPDHPPGEDPHLGRALRHGLRRHGRQVRRGPVLHRVLRGERGPGERRDVPLPGRRPVHRAAHHPAVRAHGRRSTSPTSATCTCSSS